MPKVYAYVTKGQHLLVFTQNSLQAGIQVPKGTVESGEEVLDAAVRECIEETGIQSLPPPVFLARDEWQRPYGWVEQRFFYHFSYSNLPEYWTHSPSRGGAETGLVFRFQWVAYDHAPHVLITGHDDYVWLLQTGV
ncbi:NUDIX domain-containing protein [Geomicrobium sp. JSM 1781026]|uniref:NUDIX hydrolase n=1 Tax=Geomicrobium sp. JSM 1781026 TaxID=3344580 RepID=UPI0035C1787E